MDKADRRWGVIILTHGRADRVITYSTLRKEGYTGPIYLLCDDEDEDLAKYKEAFADKVIVFNKEEWIQRSDAFYNESPRDTPLYARNAASYIAKHQLDWTHFIMMDDDYYHTYLKWNEFDESSGCHKMRCKEATDLDALFDICFDLLDDTRADVIGLAQGGDMIGGAQGSGGLSIVKRKVMNVFFISTDRCPTFRGFMNEDVNLYVEPSNNHFMFQTNRIVMDPAHTQQKKGGITETYLTFGTYAKSFMSVMCAPSCVKVDWRNSRPHHVVNYNNCCPCVLESKWKKR